MTTALALDIVQVVNVGNRPYTFKHDRIGDLTLKPGERKAVPLALCLVSLGNPGAVDSGKNRHREDERKHVFAYNGFHPGISEPEEWAELCPPIEVYSLEGDRVWMVHDDPYGEKASMQTMDAINQATDPEQIMRNAIAIAEAEAARRVAEMEAAAPTSATEVPDEPKPADEPPVKRDAPRAPRSGR